MSVKIELPNDLGDEMWDYCRLNNITDINAFALKLTKQGFTAEKYGSTPINKTKIVEKEVIKEVIKEVPVEVIKEVEKVVEKEVETDIDFTTPPAIKALEKKLLQQQLKT